MTRRRTDKHGRKYEDGKLVESPRSNSSLELEKLYGPGTAPRRARRRNTRIDPELAEVDDPDVIARTLGTFRYGKGAA